MKGSNSGERVWVTDAGDEVMLSFLDGNEEGTIYLTPKKARKLIRKLQAVLEVRAGDESFLDGDGEKWVQVVGGDYVLERDAENFDGKGATLGYVAAVWGPLSRP